MSFETRTVSDSVEPDPDLLPKHLHYDLVIVGGGIVGLTLAAALKDSGLRIAILEAQANSLAAAKGQAYNVSPLSRCILQGVGAWDALQSHVQSYGEIALSDANSPAVVRFCPRDLGLDPLGYVAEHAVLITALLQVVENSPNLDWLCPAQLIQSDTQVNPVQLHVQLGGRMHSLTTALLIGADGVKSPLREQAGMESVGWRYRQSCVVAFIQPSRSHQGIAYERFWPSGPFAILPLISGLCRIVWTAPQEEAQRLLALSEPEFMQQLQARYGSQMGELALVGQRFAFPVQLRQCQAYVQPRLALVGDAAHSCHPVGGQGLNLGIRDAAALAEVIQTAQAQGEDIGAVTVLKRYQSWRRTENGVILAMTDFLVRCFSNNYWGLVQLRRLGLRWVAYTPMLRTFVLRIMTGLTGRIPAIAQPFLEQWRQVGTPAPDQDNARARLQGKAI